MKISAQSLNSGYRTIIYDKYLIDFSVYGHDFMLNKFVYFD